MDQGAKETKVKDQGRLMVKDPRRAMVKADGQVPRGRRLWSRTQGGLWSRLMVKRGYGPREPRRD